MLNHKEKVKLARRLRTKEEAKSNKPIFGTEGWSKHAQAIRAKVEKRLKLSKRVLAEKERKKKLAYKEIAKVLTAKKIDEVAIKQLTKEGFFKRIFKFLTKRK